MTSPTINAIPNPGVQAVRIKSVALLVSQTVYQQKWSMEAYRSFSLLSPQKSSQSRKEKQPTGTDTKAVLLPVAYVSLPLQGCEASFHLPKNHSKTKESRKCLLGIWGKIFPDAIAQGRWTEDAG